MMGQMTDGIGESDCGNALYALQQKMQMFDVMSLPGLHYQQAQ
jgi:hypothetical protein